MLAGTTITVEDVATVMLYHQQDVDGIAEWYNLSLAQVHAALAYYYENKAEIDTSIRKRSQLAEDYKQKRVASRHKPLFG